MFLLSACGPGTQEAAEPGGPALESRAAGIRLVSIPAPFVLASNDPPGPVLTVPEAEGGGTVRITLSGEHSGGLNIIEAAQQEMTNFEAMPDGESFGQTKLVAPIGLTYMLRGRYTADGGSSEELRAMVAHPWGNRLLTVSYAYPVGDDTKERGGQLMALLGEIEVLPGPESEPPSGDEPPAENSDTP